MEQMPMWCPPTPPTTDNDVYIDYSLSFLYENIPMTEAQLPPIYIKKERNRNRIEAGLSDDGCRPAKMMRHKEESVYAPRSLFDRPSPALMKMRRDMKMHKYRAIVRPPVPMLKTSSHTMKTSPEPDHAMDWLVYEEWGLLHPIQSYQSLPLNTMILSPGHTPNWDMVADTINNCARLYRSPKHCRGRYETVIMPREEGKLMYDVTPKKQKKQKGGVYKTPQVSESKANRALRTSQLHNQDKNNSFTMMGNQRYEIVKSVSNKRTPTVKPLLVNSLMRNPSSTTVLVESGIQVENPMVPIDVATKRANRIAKEKQQNRSQQVLTQQQQQQQVSVRLLQHQQQQQQAAQQQQTAQQQQAGQQVVANSVGSQIHQLTQAIPTVTSASGAIIGAKAAVATNVSLSNVPTTTVVTTTVKARPGQMTMQDARTTSTNVVNLQQTTQRIAAASLVSASQASVNAASGQKGGLVGVAVATATSASKNAAQLQYFRQQQVLMRQQQQQQQQQLKVLQAQAAGGQKVSVTAMSATAVAAAAAAQQRTAAATLTKQGIATGAVAAQTAVNKQTVTRTVSDTEMAALLKRQVLQQQAKAAAAAAAAVAQVQVPTQTNLSTAQLFAQAGLQMQQAGTSAGGTPVATLVKTANVAGVRTATPQQIRQLALHPQIIAQRKLPAQKVAQLAQVASKAGVQTQLIVQQKSLPTTMTVQQIQQVMKHVQPSAMQQFSHVSTGQAVSQASQVVLAKSPLQTRVIPVASGALKQTIQVVTASNAQLRQAAPIQGKPVAGAVRRSPGPGPSSGASPGSSTSGSNSGAGANPGATSATASNLTSPGLGQVRLQTMGHSQQVQQQQAQQQQAQQDAQSK